MGARSVGPSGALHVLDRQFLRAGRVHPRRRQLPAPGAGLGHHGAGHRQRHDRRPDRNGARQGRIFAARRSHAAGAGRDHARLGRADWHPGAHARRGSGAGARHAQNKILHIKISRTVTPRCGCLVLIAWDQLSFFAISSAQASPRMRMPFSITSSLLLE